MNCRIESRNRSLSHRHEIAPFVERLHCQYAKGCCSFPTSRTIQLFT